MKFSWSRAAYHSFRWAFFGAAIGLVAGFVGSLGGGRDDLPVLVSIMFLYIFGFGRFGWELFTKQHPDE
jgi:hypothetical protein